MYESSCSASLPILGFISLIHIHFSYSGLVCSGNSLLRTGYRVVFCSPPPAGECCCLLLSGRVTMGVRSINIIVPTSLSPEVDGCFYPFCRRRILAWPLGVGRLPTFSPSSLRLWLLTRGNSVKWAGFCVCRSVRAVSSPTCPSFSSKSLGENCGRELGNVNSLCVWGSHGFLTACQPTLDF